MIFPLVGFGASHDAWSRLGDMETATSVKFSGIVGAAKESKGEKERERKGERKGEGKGGREGERERGKEGERERGREGGREGGRERRKREQTSICARKATHVSRQVCCFFFRHTFVHVYYAQLQTNIRSFTPMKPPYC